MNSSHLLQLWLDGDLDVANEQQLFAELASDSSLREEMHDLLALREVVAMDHSAFVPTEAATRGVFERLGFTPPAAKPVGWLGKYKQGIVSSTTTAVIMLLLFLWDPMGWNSEAEMLSRPTLANNGAQELAVPPTSSLSANTGEGIATERSFIDTDGIRSHSSNNAEPIEASRQIAASTTPEALEQRINLESKSASSLHDNAESSLLSSLRLTPNTETVIAQLGHARPSAVRIALQETQSAPFEGFGQIGSVARDRITPVSGASGFSNAFSVEGSELLDVRHSSSMPLISTRVDPEANSLNGFSAIYWRARSHKFWFGLAAGQEAMYQEYGHKRDDGRLVSMAQYPSVFWYGAAARYYFNSTLAESPLYSELILAANRFGPMSKLSIGAQWSPYANLTLQAGIDGQLSFYNHQQRLYTTPSLGLSYGVVFRF